MRKWLRGRASPCQGEGREFESRLPLQFFYKVWSSIPHPGVAQFGSVLDWGSRGRGFKSRHSDHQNTEFSDSVFFLCLRLSNSISNIIRIERFEFR